MLAAEQGHSKADLRVQRAWVGLGVQTEQVEGLEVSTGREAVTSNAVAAELQVTGT